MQRSIGGMAEVALGRLALRKSQNDAVRKFAQLMVDDHSKANADLKKAAQSDNVPVPSGPSQQQVATMQALARLSGSDFDKAYIAEQVRDHAQDATDFQTESQAGKDPQIKAFAAQYVGVIGKHLQLAQAIAGPQGDMNGTYPAGTGHGASGGPPASTSGQNPGSTGISPGNPNPSPAASP
jgi:putative membrane protein